MQYELSFDEFTRIPITGGTVQNISQRATVEINTSESPDTGIILYPGERYEWSDATIYARAKWGDGETVRIAAEALVSGSGGGGGSSYILPIATASTLGGVKSSNTAGKIKVESDGSMTMNLPTASTEVKGGVKAGTGVEVDENQKLNVTKATASVIGGVKSSGNDLDVVVRPDGTMYVKIASNAAAHNGIYRGKDLTEYMESGGMSAAIANGTFDDIYIGDYAIKTINLPAINYTDKAGNAQSQAAQTFANVKWLVAGLDVYRNCGNTLILWELDHHVVLIPEMTLQKSVAMNPTDDTTGGYLGSDMWRVHMPNWANAVKEAFGESHVLKHEEDLSNNINSTAVNSSDSTLVGVSGGVAWAEVYVNIPNEYMIFGSKIYSSSSFDVGTSSIQFPLFRFGIHINARSNYWLRSVASNTDFCLRVGYGGSSRFRASRIEGYVGILPYFLYK